MDMSEAVYGELEALDWLHGLDARSLAVSRRTGLSWIENPDYRTLGLLRDDYLALYASLVTTRAVDKRIGILERTGLAFGKHLSSIGNEATAVGAAYAARADDAIFPAIRTLGAFVARGMPLERIFAQARGSSLSPTGGWDASLHMSDRERRVFGLISHLGTMPCVATGFAFAEKYCGRPGAAVAFSGEGAMSTGDAHETLNIATVLRLPYVLIIENNQWAFGTPRQNEYAVPALVLRAPGYNAYGMLIDGTNVLTVYGAVRTALERAHREGSVTIIEAMTMRGMGHSLIDPYTAYVPAEQLLAWKTQKDPITNYRAFILSEGIAREEDLAAREREAEENIERAVERVRNDSFPDPTTLTNRVFTPARDTHGQRLLLPPGSGKSMTYRKAIRRALMEEMARDPLLFLIGEDIGHSGGAFKITKHFSRMFDGNRPKQYDWHSRDPIPQRRVIDAPLGEAGFCGLALGAAITGGLKAVAEFQYADFASEAFKMIVNYAATQTARGLGPFHVVFRMPSGWAPSVGPYHGVNPESWFASTPGLKIVAPATAFDAKGLLKAAIRDGNPVLYLEYKDLYNRDPRKIHPELADPVPKNDYIVPLGKARVVKTGKDLTIISYGSQIVRALDAAKQVEADDGALIEVIDLRSLIPLDMESIVASAKKTSRVLVTCEAPATGSFGQTIRGRIVDECFSRLDAPVRLVAAADTPVPFSKILEDAHLPTAEKIVAAIEELLMY